MHQASSPYLSSQFKIDLNHLIALTLSLLPQSKNMPFRMSGKTKSHLGSMYINCNPLSMTEVIIGIIRSDLSDKCVSVSDTVHVTVRQNCLAL